MQLVKTSMVLMFSIFYNSLFSGTYNSLTDTSNMHCYQCFYKTWQFIQGFLFRTNFECFNDSKHFRMCIVSYSWRMPCVQQVAVQIYCNYVYLKDKHLKFFHFYNFTSRSAFLISLLNQFVAILVVAENLYTKLSIS